MANNQHVELLTRSVEEWNQWRRENPSVRPDLREARLVNANLERALLDGADLSGADISKGQLSHASLHGANLESATLILADLLGAVLNRASLTGASFFGAFLFGTRLKSANLSGANLLGASLMGADLSFADLSSAHLMGANFHEANLTGARFFQSDLTGASMAGATIQDTEFDSCWVNGLSTWGLSGIPRRQVRLMVAPRTDFAIWVNNLELAQVLSFVLYRRSESQLVRGGDCSRVALVVGRFKGGRQAIAESLECALVSAGLVGTFVEADRPCPRDFPAYFNNLLRYAKLVIFDASASRQWGRLIQLAAELVPGRTIVPLIDGSEPRALEGLVTPPELTAPVRFREPSDLAEVILPRLMSLNQCPQE